jgi:acetoin:2,6-dichlorophenolindophenol oxidoreductase subunit beta
MAEALIEEMDRDDSVFVLGEDIAAGGVFGEAAGLAQRFGHRRVKNTPISEQLIVGAGVGAALTGLRPVIALGYADFVAVAMDEIYNKAAKWRYMHGGLFTVPRVILAPEGAAGGAGPEHSQSPEALFWSSPGLYVVTPATPGDAKGLLKSAIRDDNPVLFLPHKALMNTIGDVPEGEHLVPLGSAEVCRVGEDVTIVAWSMMRSKALQAAEDLMARGVSAEVIDPRGIRPFDFDTLLSSVRKTGRLVLAHEAPIVGGPAAEVCAVVADRAIGWLQAPIKRVGMPDVPVPQSIYLEKLALPTAADIVTAVMQAYDGGLGV